MLQGQLGNLATGNMPPAIFYDRVHFYSWPALLASFFILKVIKVKMAVSAGERAEFMVLKLI